MSQNFVEEIKERANIVDIISDYVSLKKRGANHQGLCPFHNEKTPSFVVSESKQIFTCFGCHAKGDVIEFVKKIENISFMEAIEKLASRYGVKVELQNSDKNEKKGRYYEINRQAAIFFYKNLIKGNNRGFDYVKDRKLESQTVYDFGIGYADESWDSLYTYLKTLGYEDKDLLDLGLVSSNKGKIYDKFRDRLMFPIKDVRGRVIGFGGRAIGDTMPKYLNSQENLVFQKKNNIYGLNLSKDEMSKNNLAILVEGYMDVVSLYQKGVKNVGASLGTALTENQAKLIKRYSKNIVLSYDSDSAGISAAIRGGEILKKQDIKVKVVNVIGAKDPDEYIQKKGKLAYLELCKNAPSYNNYVIDNIASKYDLKTADGKVDFSKELIPFLNSLNPMERDIYIEEVSTKYSLSVSSISREVKNRETEKRDSQIQRKTLEDDSISSKEKMILKIMMEDSYFIEEFHRRGSSFNSVQAMRIYSQLKDSLNDESLDKIKILEKLDSKDSEVLQNIIDEVELLAGFENEFNGILDSLRRESLIKKRDELLKLIELASEEGKNSELKQLMEEHRQIQREIKVGGSI